MLSNPEAADRMAKAARERFEQKFSLEVTVQALLERLTR
jgi:glycosyltransferase involved in cell wall biosynthesis